MVGYVTGEMSLREAIEAIKKNTRRFAKRQMTWFRAEPDWQWIAVDGMTPAQVADDIAARLPA